MSSVLDDDQQRIASHLRGGLLVLAPVGSGKTLTLIERISCALASGDFAPERILTLTFTNRAARQIQTRLAERFPDQVGRVWISTFHGLCAAILRAEARTAGLPADFTICDEADSLDLLRRIAAFDDLTTRRLRAAIQDAKGGARAAELRWPLDFRRIFDALGVDRAFAQRYQDELTQQGLLDFDDLVLLTTALFAQPSEARQRWEQRFDLVQVDEVQDTRKSEYNVIWVLARRSGNLALFGDLDQTIYGWRGSDPGPIVEHFRRAFAPVTQLELVRNRRASRDLVRAADGFASSFEQRWTQVAPADSAPPGEGIVVHHAPDQTAEAEWIAATIRNLEARRDDFAYSRVGVLTGTHQRSGVISEVFRREGIPHLTVEQVEFFRRPEVKDALAYVRLLLNPSDTGAVTRVLGRRFGSVESGALAELRRACEPLGMRLGDFLRPATFTTGDPFGGLLEEYRGGSVTVFDLETTGLAAPTDEIVEVAATHLEAGRATRTFHRLVHGVVAVGASARVHGLSDADLADGGWSPGGVLADFLRFIRESLLVGHNISFDLRLLLYRARQAGLAIPAFEYVDTLQLARRFVESPDYSLSGLAEHFGLRQVPNHRATRDVETTCELLERLVPTITAGEAERRALVDREAGRFSDLTYQLDEWRLLAETIRPPELLRRVLDESGLTAAYAGETRRLGSLTELVHAFELLDDVRRDPAEALDEIATHTALARNLEQLSARDDRVALITIHQAKGLEFDAVFIAGLTEGELPRRRSLHEGRLEEERRLFYVALTRARQRLYLSTHARNAFGPTRPSQFLEQLDPALVQLE